MGYRKFKGDQIFTGNQFAPENTVLITDEKGQIEGLVPVSEAGGDILEIRGILSPGFINTHCHLELSHMKGLVPPGTGMVDFLLAVMQKRNDNREQVMDAIAAAENEMMAAGIVAVGDICNTADTRLQKQMGHLHYHNFIECSGFVPELAKSRFEAARGLQVQLKETGPTSIVPHAPYSVSTELFRLIQSGSANQTGTMHNQESDAENEFFLTGQSDFKRLFDAIGVNIDFFVPPKTSSLEAVWPWLKSFARLILVHNVQTSQADLSALKDHAGIYYCLCPNANLYINNTLPPVERLMANSCNMVIGTDSLASNHQLSILEEIKTLHQHFPDLPLSTILLWATSNGAKALGIDHQFGTFEKGKQPGIIQVDDWTVTRLL